MWEQLVQSPNISKLTTLRIPILDHNSSRSDHLIGQDLISLLTSPMMSNDLIELDLYNVCTAITDDVIETIFTTRVIPGDETSPLKFGKLQKLCCSKSQIGVRGINAIVQNLPQLTQLDLSYCKNFDDAAITALIIGDDERPHHHHHHPTSPALPNLTHLYLFHNASITNKGCLRLSQSQLLDQLVVLNLDLGPQQPHHRPRRSSPTTTIVGFKTILTTPLFSNMEWFGLPDKIVNGNCSPSSIIDIKTFIHLDHTIISQQTSQLLDRYGIQFQTK